MNQRQQMDTKKDKETLKKTPKHYTAPDFEIMGLEQTEGKSSDMPTEFGPSYGPS